MIKKLKFQIACEIQSILHQSITYNSSQSQGFQDTRMLTAGTFNLCADYFSNPNPNNQSDARNGMPHDWYHRRKYVQQALSEMKCDAMALQELSPDQAIDLMQMFPGHGFAFFVQAQTPEIESGSIYTTVDQIKHFLLGKNIGTPGLIGIMWNTRTLDVCPDTESEPLTKSEYESLGQSEAESEALGRLRSKSMGIVWYNPKPFQRPQVTPLDTDQGFGNTKTPRGLGYVKFKHNQSEKEFYFFTSHAPISGGSKTRVGCFETENKVIHQIVGTTPFFSAGDRNLLPDDNDKTRDPDLGDVEAYRALVNSYPGVYDWYNPKNHLGFPGTWFGYQYEPLKYQNLVKADGTLTMKRRFDIGISSLESLGSAHYHCVIRGESVELLGQLTEADNLERNTLSDHFAVIAQFSLY